MPGWINYYYKDGVCPSHTKPGFTDLKIPTVHNITLENIMLFLNKNYIFPTTLPLSVRQTISPHAPSPSTNSDYRSYWYDEYNRKPYNLTTFFKGPLLYANIMTNNLQLGSINTSIISYKRAIKFYVLVVQGSGDSQEWHNDNFAILNIPGLRKSDRLRDQHIN